MRLIMAPSTETERMMNLDLSNPALKLTREQAAQALTLAGYKTSQSTLATYASRGGGPRFRKWGARSIYELGELLTWAESRLGKLQVSASDTAHAA